MATKTDIANKSLTSLGVRILDDVDTDDTVESRAVLAVYDILLRSILSEAHWNFAIKRVLLDESSYEIPFSPEGLTVAYDVPSDHVVTIEPSSPSASYYEEDGKILSSTNNLGLRYVYFKTDTTSYPSYFVTAFSDLIASELAYPLLNSASKGRDMMEKYERISLPKAISVNSQSTTPREIRQNYWLDARLGGANIPENS